MNRAMDLYLMHRFRACAETDLPGRVRRVVLFGSRAQRDAHPGSDWDVAVFVAGPA